MAPTSIYKTKEGSAEIHALYDAVLSRWPVSHQERTLSTRYGDTFVLESGLPDAPPLVLIHGASSNASSWIGDAAAYAEHFRVLAVDLPGEPGRSTESRLPYTDNSHALWLRDVLDGIGAEEVSLLGISLGGWVATRFATEFPGMVRKLVLLAPGGVVPTRLSFLLRGMIWSLQGQRGAKKINEYVMGKRQLHPEAVRVMNTIMTHFRSRIEKEHIFTDDELRRLTMPVLVLGGEQDVIRSAQQIITRLQILAPSVESILIPDTGHCLVNLAGTITPFLTQ